MTEEVPAQEQDQSKYHRPIARRPPEEPPISERSPIDEAEKLEPGVLLGTKSKHERMPRWKFTIPESVRTGPGSRPDDPLTVTIRELDEDDLDDARRIGDGAENSSDKARDRRMGEAALLMSLYAVNGRPVNQAEAEPDFYWAKWGMKVKMQLLDAWRRMHGTTKEEDKDFFDSMERA